MEKRTIRLYFVGEGLNDVFHSPVYLDPIRAHTAAMEDDSNVAYIDVEVAITDLTYTDEDES